MPALEEHTVSDLSPVGAPTYYRYLPTFPFRHFALSLLKSELVTPVNYILKKWLRQ